MEPVNPLKSFSLANAATPAILSGSLADDPPAVRQDRSKGHQDLRFFTRSFKVWCASLHGKRHGTSIDELRRNAKYMRALLSGYSINSSSGKHESNPRFLPAE